MHKTVPDILLDSVTMTLQLFDGSKGEIHDQGEPLALGLDSQEIITHNNGPLTGMIPEGYEANLSGSIQLRSVHQLCLACKSCLSYFCKSQYDPKRKKNNMLHSSSLSTVFTSTERECAICSQLRNRIGELDPELGPGVYSEYSIICCWSTYRDDDKETKMWMVMLRSPASDSPVHSYRQILQLGLWSKKHFGQYFENSTKDGESTDNGLYESHIEGTNESDYTKDLAKSWLARCIQNDDGQHDICNKGDQDYIPTRLLDIQHALENNVVRLVCPDKEDEKFKGIEYATLSYCWGRHAVEQNPMLLTNNLELWQNEGFTWARLPKIFQDAFRIASWLGLEWLWIDSMCIIQDLKSDWKLETKAMDQIYTGAKVNISADAGEDSRSGCFVQRKKTDITLLQFATHDLGNEWIVTMDDTFERMNSATSRTRAWTHRERQLSRRILHCTAKEMVWECCALGKSSFASETMPRGLPFDKVFNGETKFQLQIGNASNTNLSKRERRERLHMLWNSICQDFANKSVSCASDLPYILWGLAYEFHTLFNGEEYVCGHWRSNLAESLTWWIPGVKPEHNGYLAPSWSWMSAGCPVHLAQLHSNRHRRAVVEIQSVSRAYESRPDNGFGKHAPGSSVSVNGFLRRVRFDFSGPEEDEITLSVVEEDEDGDDRIRHIGRHRNLMGDPTFRLTMDHRQKLPSCGLDCYALFTTLQETGDCKRQLSCVLLKHESVIHNGPYQYHTYKRIGTMDNIGDLYSFKLRYRVAPSVKVPDAGVSRMDSGDTCTGEDVSEDIWNLLSQYLRCVRWDVISRFKESGMPDTSGYSSLEEDEEDESEWEEDSLPSRPQSVTGINDNEEETRVRPTSPQALTEGKGLADINDAVEEGQIEDAVPDKRHRQMLRDLSNIVLCIYDHPFLGLANITDIANAAEAADHLRQVLSFESQTVAYGTNIREDPGEVLYQFDDVLDIWQKTHGVVPWLERLETSVFTII